LALAEVGEVVRAEGTASLLRELFRTKDWRLLRELARPVCSAAAATPTHSLEMLCLPSELFHMKSLVGQHFAHVRALLDEVLEGGIFCELLAAAEAHVLLLRGARRETVALK
jgi:hypothetical protein